MQGLIAQGLAKASEQDVATMCELMEALARYWRTGDPADEAQAADAEARLFAKNVKGTPDGSASQPGDDAGGTEPPAA